ncbi:hypothetical protein [Burkholderia sp. Ac-20344]|uniref:T6SS immunity protein Tli3 family protein n=1 Tax=Burkholderia sp. Ac-20344 TaxID=2703890 RepID=UPI00197B5705|nr:hypothetical protein [Burkholderia sp. Ac-20344]MBN3830774.1 hypothetical protein [Burkholderia sp. Ac-20344]
MWQRRIRSVVAVVAIFLGACVHADRPVRKTVPEEDWHEYVVYRIDDHRYISIRSPQTCDGHIDGNIYYNDTRSGVRTFVSFTGSAANGLYRGYYAVRANPTYIAIPALAFSQTSGMLLRIYYSYDGGKNFQWFLVGDESANVAIIVDEEKLYLTAANFRGGMDYSGKSGVAFDISRDMNWRIAHYRAESSAFDAYAKTVYGIPRNIRSPSGQTHWRCPSMSADK